MKRSIVVFILLAITGIAKGSTVGLRAIDHIPIVKIDSASNRGSVSIGLRNYTTDSMSLFLHCGFFIVPSNGRRTNAEMTFSLQNTQKKERHLEITVPPGRPLFLELEISGFTEAGEAVATLLNDAGRTPDRVHTVQSAPTKDTIVTIHAVKFNVPFNVNLKPVISAVKNKTSYMTIFNDDPMSYPIAYRLFLSNGDTPITDSTGVVPAKSSIEVPLPLLNNIFPPWYKRLFRDYDVKASAVLKYEPQQEVEFGNAATKSVPLHIKMNKTLPDVWADALLYAIIILALVCGSASSIFMYLFIPNTQKKVALLQRLDVFHETIKLISNRIDSSLRVTVRLERINLFERIKRLKTFYPIPSAHFSDYQSTLAGLEQRVALILDLDRATALFEGLHGKSLNAPAALLVEIKENIRCASDILKLNKLEEKDYQEAQQTIQAIYSLIKNMNEANPKLAEKLAECVNDLKIEYDEHKGVLGKMSKCQNVRPKLKELFDIFTNPDYGDATKIKPISYHWLSSCIERLCVLRHYIRVWEYADADKAKRDRIEQHENVLLDQLQQRTWNSLFKARLIRDQIQENIYTEDVTNALSKKQFIISHTPLLPLPNQKVQLGIQFQNKNLMNCAAKHDITCIWDFDNVGKEIGWDITHFFRIEDDAQCSVSFYDCNGNKIITADGGSVPEMNGAAPVQGDEKKISNPIDTKIPLDLAAKDKFEYAFALEGTKFVITLLIAIFGLITGAKEQLLKLGFMGGIVGTFILGFSADSIKNLITRQGTINQK